MYLIGFVLKPQGIKGEIKVIPVSDNLERFSQLDTVYIESKDIHQAYPVQGVRVTDRFVFIKLAGIESRDSAETLRGAELRIREKDLLQPAGDEYFVHDLVGCQVFTEKGDLIGQLQEIVQLTSNDLWVVRDATEREYLIPAIKEVISQVDIKGKKITIHVIEGLLDLNK